MLRALILTVGVILCSLPRAALAEAPAVPTPDPAEAAFVRTMRADLTARFPTAAAAERGGYLRYTDVDDTGAISYANLRWNSADPHHPSQLWYDVAGRLLGADFSVPKTGPTPPRRWGLRPSRWSPFEAHIHYVAIGPAGRRIYGLSVSTTTFRGAGGDPAHPTAATLVKLGLVKHVDDVALIFLFPEIWDASVWVTPNPNGAFAEKNPLVTPSR